MFFSNNLCKLGLALAVTLSLAQADVRPAAAQSGSLTTLYTFSGPDGGYVNSFIQGTDGNFYGTTYTGGAPNYDGTVFRITPAGSLTVLHSFNGSNGEPGNPVGIVQASDGNFYVACQAGGASFDGGIVQIKPDGTAMTLYTFMADGVNGFAPAAGLIQGSDGALYGTTYYGGGNGSGTIYKITTRGVLTTLYSFSALSGMGAANADGAYPQASLVQASDGNFYGTASYGGVNGAGTAFRFSPAGTFNTLYAFTGSSDGAYPRAPLALASDGNLYGSAAGSANLDGSLFRVTPAGVLTPIFTWLGVPADPTAPVNVSAGLIQANDGYLYGGTQNMNANGTLFRTKTAGGLTSTLYTFPDFSGPASALIQASDGSFYGTTYQGGSYQFGTVFHFTVSSGTPLQSLSPTSVNAGGPDFTLIVKGSAFASNAIVKWNGIGLYTTYVSASELKASVPSTLIQNAGTAQVAVATPGMGSSASKSFTILVTTLKLMSASLSRNSTTGVITANVNIENLGYLAAPNVKVTKASLGSANTSSSLPVGLGSIPAFTYVSTSLSFPGSAGTSGTVVYLKVSGTFTGGKFSGSLKVTLP